MALMDFIKKQFIDVIHWTEEGEDVLAYRFPMQDFEIQSGAQLTVRESQMAVFINEGNLADAFAPGRYKLTTQTLPLLTNLMNWDKLFASPFKSDVYFFSTRLRLDRKWGTPNPITIRDKDFGMVRLRAFGIYSYRLTDPKIFHKEVSGTRDVFTVEDLDGQLRNTMIAAITATFGSSNVPFIDMAGNQLEFAKAVRVHVEPMFTRLGLTLDSLVVENISLPEEIQKMLDTRIGMNMLGDMNRYTQYQTANAIPIAAGNEGGLAGIGASLAAGVGIGGQMAAGMAGAMAAMQPGHQAPPAQAPGAAPTPGPAPAPAPAAGANATDEVMATLEKLHGLVGKGILSQQEFDAKKAELLKKLA
ncbi:MAG: SPFH domain-containing protein [Betaproteobacteria bacterium]|nr:SPFH domain-containing protein [Betaproteobacteria bacterium]